jgi:hypothetical protein
MNNVFENQNESRKKPSLTPSRVLIGKFEELENLTSLVGFDKVGFIEQNFYL